MIKQLYAPIQPMLRIPITGVSYRETSPDIRIQEMIYCYWQLKTSQPLLQQFDYRVVADGCIDIFFDLNAPQENFVMGFCKQYTEFSLGYSFNYIGIRFFPAIFPLLFKIDAAELSHRCERLNMVVAQLSDFISHHFNNTDDLHTIKTTLDQYFLHYSANHTIKEDIRFYEALHRILNNSGKVSIEKGLETGLSSRQLRRLFEFYIGDSAKTFSRVVRFQKILQIQSTEYQTLLTNPIFCEAGYYDQAHFIKEFKSLYGITPCQAFQ